MMKVSNLQVANWNSAMEEVRDLSKKVKERIISTSVEST